MFCSVTFVDYENKDISSSTFFYRRFLRWRKKNRFYRRNYFRRPIRRPRNGMLNTVILRPNWTDNVTVSKENTRYLIGFSFTDLPELGQFSRSFGYFRMLRFRFEIIPKFNNVPEDKQTGTYVYVPFHRYMDATALENLAGDDILDLERSRSARSYQKSLMNVVPAVITNVNTIPNGSYKTLHFRPWLRLDTEGMAVKHYGLLVAFPSDSIGNQYLIVTRVYVQLRGYKI